MSSREFAEWRAYAQLAPFGERAWALRFGRLAQVVYQMLSAKGAPPHDWDYFFPAPQILEDDLPWGAEEYGVTNTSGLEEAAPMRDEAYLKSRTIDIVKLFGGTITNKDGTPFIPTGEPAEVSNT